MPGRFGLVARLALLTGHRSDKLAALTWDHVEGDVLRFPSPPRKSRKRWAEVVPITAGIRRILEAAERHRVDGGQYVFWTRSRNDGDYLPSEPSATRLRRRAGISKTVKELRHTAKTRMARLGVRERVSEALLGHSQNGVAARYDHHDYLVEARAALERLEEHLMATVSGASMASSEICEASEI